MEEKQDYSYEYLLLGCDFSIQSFTGNIHCNTIITKSFVSEKVQNIKLVKYLNLTTGKTDRAGQESRGHEQQLLR